MADFASFMGGGNAPTGSVAAAPEADSFAHQNAVAKSTAGGVKGFLYNNLVQPTLNAVASVPGDIYNTVDAAHSLAQGKQDQAYNLYRQTTAGSSAPTTLQEFRNQGVGKNLEEAGGNIAGQAINIAAPVVGGEELAGKGALAVLKGGAKLGATYGATQGAANSAAQGGNAGDLAAGALTGGAEGALAGTAGGAAGALIGKVAGKAANRISGQGADTAATTASKPNVFDRAATNQAQDKYAAQANDEFGHGGAMASNNGTPINAVLADMNGHGIAPGVTPMAQYGHAGFAYNDLLDGLTLASGKQVPVDKSQLIKDAFIGQSGLGSASAKGSQANQIAQGLRDHLDSLLPEVNSGTRSTSGTDITTPTYHAGDLQAAARGLYDNAAQTTAEGKVYANLRSALIDAAGNEGGVNKAISEYQLPSVADHNAGIAPSGDVQHILNAAGGNESLAQKIVDNLNSAKTIQNVQQAEIPHIAANELASSHAQAIGKTLPDTIKGTKGSFSSVTPTDGYMAAAAIHNPIMGAALVARKTPGVVDRTLAKFGTADTSQVGPRAIPDVTGGSSPAVNTVPTSDVPAGGAPAGSGPPPAAVPIDDHSASNVLDRMMGGVHAANIGAAVAGNATGQPQVGAAATPTDTTGAADTAALPTNAGSATSASSGASTSPYSQEQMLADIQRDPKNQANYLALYKQLQSDAKSPLSANEQKMSDAVQNAAGSIQVLMQQFKNAGDSTNPLSAFEANLPGAISSRLQPNLSAYNKTRYDAASALASATVGGKPTASSIAYWEKSLPAAGESGQAAQQKIDNVMQLLAQRGKLYGIDPSQLVVQ